MARVLCSSLRDVVMENVEVLKAGFAEVNGHGSESFGSLGNVKLLISGLEMA